MKYGFVIDNRKCIGCHACTTACKSEHDTPVGVNRTWVKQVEKGEFPNTRRLFSVMRCNHCTDAPCVEICPTEALFIRDDGIVDFNSDRCIGCKSCMQGCPYDALYIDPATHTAAKCNYCAHRIDIGLEPACVNVCPEHAIISGDMENPETEISELLARQQVKVRKAEKGTTPNLFYIDADDLSLNPTATDKSDQYFWNAQEYGVGHFAKEAEKMAYSNPDVLSAILEAEGISSSTKKIQQDGPEKSVSLLLNKPNGQGKRVYDTPDKGLLWGWEVSAYVWTKAIAAGAFLIPFIASFFGLYANAEVLGWSYAISLIFLALTGVLLVMDLDQPKRFAYVLLRPQWKSWLVKGAYLITGYGALLTLSIVCLYFGWKIAFISTITAITAVGVAIYTAFLFAQAKGRDFWQSPTMVIHMFLHSLMAGAAVFLLAGFFIESLENWIPFLKNLLIAAVVLNLLTMWIELTITHPTDDAKKVVEMIRKGRYRRLFFGVVVLLGNLVPLGLMLFTGELALIALGAAFSLIGIYYTEKVWVEAPQRISLS